jgi:hypothetical protein
VRKDRPVHPRTGIAYGGVIIAFRNDLVASHRCDLDTECEIVWLQVDLVGCKPLMIGAFYRPQTTAAAYLDKLRESISKLNIQNLSNIWIGGDFNLYDINWQDLCVKAGGKLPGLCQSLIDIISDFGFEQLVRKPTRLNNILDLFMTTNPSLVESCSYLPGISDHDAIPIFTINTRAKKNKSKPHKIFLYKKANVEGLQKEIREISDDYINKDITSESTEDLWTEFKDRVLSAINTNVPSKMVSGNKSAPWLNQSLKRRHKQKQCAFNTMRKDPTPENVERFKELRREIKKETRKRKRNFIRDTTLESSKQFYSYIKSMKNDNSGIQALKDGDNLISDNKGKAHLLNTQFMSVFTEENDNARAPIPSPLEQDITCIPDIEISEDGVRKCLEELNPNKAAGPDGISPWVLRTSALAIAPALSVIFRSSLYLGTLPKDWLQAHISPIFKKGDRSLPLNYRPVSLTSVCSKILEHIIHSSVMTHLDQHNLLCQEQHGFRKGHSCESQLINTMHDLTSASDINKQTDMVIMDFEKAFDKVPHKRLLSKIHEYGIRGKLLSWITTFLTERMQRVVVNGECSSWGKVTSGVPQGTVTGPLWFLIFINDLPLGIQSHIRLFADDCVIYRTITCPADADLLQQDLCKLTDWQNKWLMRFNEKKCYVMRISKARSPLHFEYSLNGSQLQSTSCHSYLGVEISNDLKWNQHISNTAAKANRTLGFIRRNLKSCSTRIKLLAYHTLIRPILEYGAPVWDPYTHILIDKLESIQRRATRFIMNDFSRYSSVTDMMSELDIKPLITRRKIARLATFHKAREGLLAIPIRKLLQPVKRFSRHSNENNFIPIRANKDCYLNSFLPATTRDWNSLPHHITSINLFKQAIINHYSK